MVHCNDYVVTQIAMLIGPTWGPPGSCRPQMGPMLAPWTLLLGQPTLLIVMVWWFSTRTDSSCAQQCWWRNHASPAVYRLICELDHLAVWAQCNIKISSYQYRKSHCGDKTVVRSSYLHNGITYADRMSSLYWIRALVTHACQWTGSSLIQLMAGRLVGAQSLLEPMMTYCQ